MENITKQQDGDGHWYWIPNRLLHDFNVEMAEIGGLDYMDNPDLFDSFIDKYDKYRTLGSPDNEPDFFKQRNEVAVCSCLSESERWSCDKFCENKPKFITS